MIPTQSERSGPSSVPLFHSKEVEQRNTDAAEWNGTRNTSGTPTAGHLRILADTLYLSRAATGTPTGTHGEQTGREAFRPPGTPVENRCAHVADPQLAEWYAEHPELTCMRCWLAVHGGRVGAPRRRRSHLFASIADMKAWVEGAGGGATPTLPVDGAHYATEPTR